MIESLITYFLLFLCAFSVVEIARLITFKNCLQAANSYIAHKIAYSQIDLTQKNLLSKNSGENDKKELSKKVSNEIENYLNKISSTLISYDNKEKDSAGVYFIKKHDVRVRLKFVYNSNALPSGVYIESLTCLPVLFSSYFRHIKDKTQVGKLSHDDSRTCLGNFNSSVQLPLYWFRVRVAAYSPWPASTQIYNSGLALPNKFEALEQDNRIDALAAINSGKLTEFFNSTTIKNRKKK
ncbi:MAG: hypothetical protein V4591_12325 [Bdellovibrionota bacterium]